MRKRFLLFACDRKLLLFCFDILGMRVEKREFLVKLRKSFELAAASARFKASTKVRYRSWIRRYLAYCISLDISIDQSGAVAFLKSYKNYSTRRQGYYALRFLFLRVMKNQKFFSLLDCFPECTKTWSMPKKRWWKRWRR